MLSLKNLMVPWLNKFSKEFVTKKKKKLRTTNFGLMKKKALSLYFATNTVSQS